MNREITKLYPSAHFVRIEGTKDYHTVRLRLKCKDKNEFKEWLLEHQRLSGVTYRVQCTTPCTGKKVIYKAHYRCQHNTYPASHQNVKSASAKHTDCRAKLKLSIQSIPEGRMNYSKDELRLTYPSIVEVHHTHNHKIDSVETTKYKDVSEEVKKKFLELFKDNHGPAESLEIHKQDLMDQYEENYILALSDRSICPDIRWVYHFYYTNFKKDEDALEKMNDSLVSESSLGKENEDESRNETVESDEKQNLIKALLESFENRLIEVSQNNPKEFISALRNMQDELDLMETKDFLAAMHCFGKSRSISLDLTPEQVKFSTEHSYCKQRNDDRYHPYKSFQNVNDNERK